MPSSVIRKGPWKLIETFDPEGIELYNLADDLSETKNLAATETAKVNELRRELDAWRKEVGAEMMKPNPDYDPQREALEEEKEEGGSRMKRLIPAPGILPSFVSLSCFVIRCGAAPERPLHRGGRSAHVPRLLWRSAGEVAEHRPFCRHGASL